MQSSLLVNSTVLTDRQFETISGIVKGLCGINLHEGKKELVKARLAKRLRQLALPDFTQYIKMLREDASGTELTAMLDALSTNTTHFFRESRHFDYFRDVVLPELLRKNQAKRRIRIWSAGCSSGEEPYTIAILLKEHLPPGASNWDVKILATDISTKVLARAREGIYSAPALRDAPKVAVYKYFTPLKGRSNGAFQVNASLRKLVHFARLNLMQPWPMKGPFDVIFCRNVMIYFDKSTQGRLVERYYDILAPGGTFFIGHSESLPGIRHKFSYVAPTVYTRL